jgi:integrase
MRKEKYISEHATFLRIFISKTINGKRMRYTKQISFADHESKRDAMNYAIIVRDRMLSDLRCNSAVNSIPTVSELYSRTQSLMNVSIKTWKRHGIAYRHSIEPYGDRLITEIKSADIQTSINDSISHYSLDATQRVLAVWKQIYRVAAMLDVNVPDRTAAVVIPRDRKVPVVKHAVTISEEDFEKYILYLSQSLAYTRDAVGKYRKMRVIYMLQIMHDTGLRPSECMALDRLDIDIENSVIHVSKRVGSDASKSRQIVAPKTSQSIRDVPISDHLNPILIQMLVDITDTHLFWDIDNLPMEISTLSCFISRTSKDAGVEFNMYMLRHNMATELIQSGTSARTTQDILGHANYRQSVGYARSSESERKQAIDRLKQ